MHIQRKPRPHPTTHTPQHPNHLVQPPNTNWTHKIQLTPTQALIAFTKYGTHGIGFQQEQHPNLNRPHNQPATTILNHIWPNKGKNSITKTQVLTAIKLLQLAIKQDQPENTK